jgi:hypothetical protein
MDVENFSGGEDIWGDNIPRLEQGLHLIMQKDMWGNDLGGFSGAIFPYAIPQGQHGFALPGEMTDWAIKICKLQKGDSDPSCSETAMVGNTYDVGWAMFHLFGQYILHGDTQSPIMEERCWSLDACSNIPEVPPARESEELP